MKILKITILICVVTPLLSFSDEFSDDHCEAAKLLIAREGGPEEYRKNLREGLDAQIAMNPQLGRFRNVFVQWQDAYLGWDTFEPRYVEIICSNYSEDDIKALLDFYDTEPGAKLLEKGSEIMGEVMKMAQEIAMERQPELGMMLEKRMKEIQVELGNLIPEYKEEDEGQKEHIIYNSSNWNDGKMEEFVYSILEEELISTASINPFDGVYPVSISEALEIAFQYYSEELNCSRSDFEEEVVIKIDNFEFTPEQEDENSSAITRWFYVVEVGYVRSATMSMPPDVVVLGSGKLLSPQKKG